jgi:DnaJ-class molecular chaperone
MTKEEIGKQIEALRKECGVSTYELEQKGIHPSLPATIEKGQKGYSMDSLIKYLNAIDEDIFLSVGKKKRKRFKRTGYRIILGEVAEPEAK